MFYILCGASLFNISIPALREEGDIALQGLI